MTARRYAEGSSVPVARSRASIDKILREWGCSAVRWTDAFEAGRIVLEFVWPHEGLEYPVRLEIVVPDCSIDARGYLRTEGGEAKALDAELRRLHRVLAEWVKMSFNAIDSGLVEAAELWMPFLADRDGMTLGRALLPRLPKILESSAGSLFALPKEASS